MAKYIALIPEAAAVAAKPPSTLAILLSKEVTVGLEILPLTVFREYRDENNNLQ